MKMTVQAPALVFGGTFAAFAAAQDSMDCVEMEWEQPREWSTSADYVLVFTNNCEWRVNISGILYDTKNESVCGKGTPGIMQVGVGRSNRTIPIKFPKSASPGVKWCADAHDIKHSDYGTCPTQVRC